MSYQIDQENQHEETCYDCKMLTTPSATEKPREIRHVQHRCRDCSDEQRSHRARFLLHSMITSAHVPYTWYRDPSRHPGLAMWCLLRRGTRGLMNHKIVRTHVFYTLLAWMGTSRLGQNLHKPNASIRQCRNPSHKNPPAVNRNKRNIHSCDRGNIQCRPRSVLKR